MRYAGDEFVVFLRGDAGVGREVAERIRSAVARADVLAGVRLTVSVGLAALAPGMSADALFRAADERLYAQKLIRSRLSAAEVVDLPSRADRLRLRTLSG